MQSQLTQRAPPPHTFSPLPPLLALSTPQVEKSLWYWNLAMAILHGVQAIIVLAGSQTQANAKRFKIQMITTIPSWAGPFPVAAIQTRGELSFASLTSGFAFLSSAAHIVVLLCFTTYIADLRKGLNVFRWYEYALSSSLMIVLIAMLFGNWDQISLFQMGAVNACMCLFGLLHERMNAGKPASEVNWEPFIFGCFAGAAPWAAIFSYLGASADVSRVPTFVWAILGAYLFFFNTFPINMWLQYRQTGWWSDKYWGFQNGGYYFGERMYQVQSLVSKSLLLWLVYGGANQPSASTA